uniref:Integrin alpha-7 n=1 Tax=Laticauda laticaudata TaxID=8630 RepID=A0A8C5SPH7_LATLA
MKGLTEELNASLSMPQLSRCRAVSKKPTCPPIFAPSYLLLVPLTFSSISFRLLVGAPQATALPDQQAQRTGGLYACPLTYGTKDCERVPIDEGGMEHKENQWLGVTVNSQGPGGKIVTCAHLYEARNRVNESLETRHVIGRCYVLSEGLQVADELDGGEWKFCQGREQGHERFGYCQQGIATGFTADRHYILFGAPGTYNWKGKPLLSTKNIIKSGSPDPHLGRQLKHTNELSFVTGAPRANHIGSVVILHQDNFNRLVPEVILSGEKLASSFGYSLAVVDLNHDGWMDLVVGAPNFFDRKERIGGAVYIYINQAGHWENILPIRLNGTSDSLFGITVGAIGDLNQDGFQGEILEPLLQKMGMNSSVGSTCANREFELRLGGILGSQAKYACLEASL